MAYSKGMIYGRPEGEPRRSIFDEAGLARRSVGQGIWLMGRTRSAVQEPDLPEGLKPFEPRLLRIDLIVLSSCMRALAVWTAWS